MEVTSVICSKEDRDKEKWSTYGKALGNGVDVIARI
jgi:hypothetical protein